MSRPQKSSAMTYSPMSVNSTNGSKRTRPSTTTVVATGNEEIVTMVDMVDTAVAAMAATTTISSNTRQPRKAHPDRQPLQHLPPVLALVLLPARLTTVRSTPNTTEPTRTLHTAVTRTMLPIINITNSMLSSNKNSSSSSSRRVLLHSHHRHLAKLPRPHRRALVLPLRLRLGVTVTAL